MKFIFLVFSAVIAGNSIEIYGLKLKFKTSEMNKLLIFPSLKTFPKRVNFVILCFYQRNYT